MKRTTPPVSRNDPMIPGAPAGTTAMWKRVGTAMKEDISLYQWIYEYLLMMIQCGVVSHGESLPPIWDLADKFHVSIRPVQQALAMLESQGWIAMDGKRFRVVARLTPEEIEQNYAVHFWSRRDAIRDIYAFESMVSADILLAALQLLPEKDAKRLSRWEDDPSNQDFIGSIYLLEEMLHPLGNPMLTGLLCDLALFQAYPFSARGGEKDGGFLCSCGSLLSLLGLCRQRNHAEARRQICQHLDDNALRLYASFHDSPQPPDVQPVSFEWQVYRGRPRQVYSVVYKLIHQIALGELPMGQRLPPINTLADQFGVSRSTIRRATGVMNSIGVTQPSGGKGTKPVPLTPEAVANGLETYTMRTMMAKYLQALQIFSLTAPGIIRDTFLQIGEQQLASAAANFREIAASGRWNTITELFCQLMIDASGNGVVRELYARLLEQLVWGHPLSCLAGSPEKSRMYCHCADTLALYLERRDLDAFCREAKWHFDSLLLFGRALLLQHGAGGVKPIVLVEGLPKP